MSSVSRSMLAMLVFASAQLAGSSAVPHQEDADMQLAVEMNAQGSQLDRVNTYKEALRSTYNALPKNQEGNLPHQSARYILHRVFVDRHGWYIRGLEPNGDVFHTATHEDSIRDWVPSYLMDHMEHLVGHRGLSLNDLGALAAAMEDLIREEADDLMADVADVLTVHRGTPTPEQRIQRVKETVRVYMASYLSGAVWDGNAAYWHEREFFAEYTHLERTEAWWQAIVDRHLNETKKETGYEVAKHVGADIGKEFRFLNDEQCHELKQVLIGTWGKARTTGRIRLSDFYKVGLDSQWVFSERKEYLKALGALDDSNESSPMVIIPNYISSMPNCLQSTNLYSVCCRDECEQLLGHLEQSIAAPSAKPERIVELISNLASDTVSAPRELDSKLVDRLYQIAETHDFGGEVKLHGRLFSQWLHHVYPNECPYPHEAGTSDPSSPEEWMGAEVLASTAERQEVVDAETCGPEQAADEWTVELPWSHTEELLPGSATKPSDSASSTSYLWVFVGVVAVLGVAAGAAALGPKAIAKKVSPRQLALLAFVVVLVITNLVNWVLLVVIGCVGLLLHRFLAMDAQHVDKMGDKVVCMV